MISKMRMIGLMLISALLAAQTTPPLPVEAPDKPLISVRTEHVVAPVTVQDKDGSIVNGLEPGRFHLYDNNKAQDIRVDVAFQPMSMVIAIQASDRVDAVLGQIRKVGSLIEPLVIGEQGEASVIAFDSRIRELQTFTNDATKIKEAIAKIHAGSTSSRMIDAVDRGVFLLRNRDPQRRRVVLLISERQDMASEGRLREALIDAQLANVTIYCVDISRVVTNLTAKAQPPRPDPLPPAAHGPIGGYPETPTSRANITGLGSRIEFVPMMVQVFKGVKGAFIESPPEAFAKATGGTQFSFVKQRGLEDAIQAISQEIHSQYMVSYAPNNRDEGGWHEIRVQVDEPGLTVRTRPGYWLAAGQAK
ncbi:MAG TPA: hypothetical protein DEQ47_00325 [Solibacterales bacterium]|nr:hypothetical protein [Bryobacterales bacterium]